VGGTALREARTPEKKDLHFLANESNLDVFKEEEQVKRGVKEGRIREGSSPQTFPEKMSKTKLSRGGKEKLKKGKIRNCCVGSGLRETVLDRVQPYLSKN